jgi:long-chain acyl-CoA synthetase
MRRRFESVLAAAGVSDGHVIVSVVGNRPEFLGLLLAVWSLGAAVMPVDLDTNDDEVARLAARFGAAGIVRVRRAPEAEDCVPLGDALSFRTSAPGSWARLPGAVVLKLTSGSSGAPKAVRAVEATLLNDADHIVSAMGIRPDDTQIAVIPLSHSYGFGNLVLPLLCQGTAMVLRESFVPQAVCADARLFGARVIPGVPFMFQHFAAYPPEDGWPPSLTLVISAGARLAPETIRAFWDRFHIKVHSFYGTSETGGIAYDHSSEVDDGSTVGWPMAEVHVELREGDVPDGYGRVHVQSNAVAPDYVGDPDDSESLADGGFLTGDYGRFLPDGRLMLAGRISSFINVAGRKVQPGEVERLLREVPGIVAARVLAAADPVRGEQIAAVVVGESSLTVSVIRRYCAERLPAHKIPRIIVIATAMPMTARGKTDYRALQALVSGHVGRTV